MVSFDDPTEHREHPENDRPGGLGAGALAYIAAAAIVILVVIALAFA